MDPDALEKMLARGQDSPMLRLTLGKAYRERGEFDQAVAHLRQGVSQDPAYSAAWQELGHALQAGGERDAAREAYVEGLRVAEANGDMQVVKMLKVFIKRLDKQ